MQNSTKTIANRNENTQTIQLIEQENYKLIE